MQLFTHLLSSYLQGMGDFFSALPWGRPGWGLWVDVVVGRWASQWGVTAPLAVCATPVTHAMLPMVISRSVMGIAATLLTAIPTCAIITAGS